MPAALDAAIMGVHNLTADAEVFTANAYLVTGAVNALVDVGVVEGVDEEIATHVDTLDLVALTHQHGDHVGELDAVLDRFEADLYAYEAHPRRTHQLTDGDTVQLGDDTYEAVYTPGHAADHLAFLGETAIYTGDVVVYADGAFEGGSFGRTDMAGQSRERLIESLRSILERLGDDVTHMYPGHGPSYEGDVRAVIERALERAERREPKYDD